MTLHPDYQEEAFCTCLRYVSRKCISLEWLKVYLSLMRAKLTLLVMEVKPHSKGGHSLISSLVMLKWLHRSLVRTYRCHHGYAYESRPMRGACATCVKVHGASFRCLYSIMLYYIIKYCGFQLSLKRRSAIEMPTDYFLTKL